VHLLYANLFFIKKARHVAGLFH